MLKHYVEFYYPGSFLPETDVKEIKNRETKITLPKGSYGYQFFDIEEVVEKGELLKGQPKNHSGMYYKGKLYSYKEAQKEFADKKILLSNMKNNGWKWIVCTVAGNFQPFFKKRGDCILD